MDRRARLVALLLAAAAPGALAIPPPPQLQVAASPGSDPVLAPAWLDLVLNGVTKGTTLVYLAREDAWVAAEDLERAGLRIDGGERVERSGRSLVSLASLSNLLSFRVDEAALAVRIDAREPVLQRTSLDLRRIAAPEGLVHREPASAYLNWALAGDSDDQRSASAELGVAIGPALLLGGVSVDRVHGAVRGLTTGTWDDRRRLVRWAAGDVVVPQGDALAGSGLVGGLSVGREFSLDPYLLRAPYPRTSVFAATPATLEVWIDDALVRRALVQPGTIDVENIPVNAGLSQIRTVLRDAFGREESASTFALFGTTALAPGLTDLGATVGARRLMFGVESFSYGGPLGQARLRRGLTKYITLGARVEGGEDLVSGGGGATLVTALGELEATGAASSQRGESGAAAVLTWRRLARRASAVAQLRWDSGRYANGSLDSTQDRPVVRGTLSGSTLLTARVSLLGDVTVERRREGGELGRVLGRLVYTLPRGIFAALSVSRTVRSVLPDATEVLVTVSLPGPGRSTAEIQGSGGVNASEYAQATLTKPLPAGPGAGYRLAARGGDGGLAEAELRAQERFIRAEARHTEVEPWSGGRRRPYTTGQIASGIVFIDGRLFATRPVDGAYALVRVDDAPGVQVFMQGQDMGRTNGDGDLLVTGLQPYLANRIGIRDSDLPLDFRVDEVERNVAPRHRGGSVERFRAVRQIAVAGRLLLVAESKESPPEWGELAVEVPGRRVVSPVGRNGAFWLEGIPPGTHDALLRWEGKLCRFAFEVPAGAKGTVDLGTVRCDQLL